ncbi:RNA polymerase II-binding domain-containing protein [Lasiosphaeria miniovina]|uniref:RNA polymerase II-binding domain-containing protein n=1 Tax=Lasiosphaeria miniovina TaxID=1954250 RepID=A0AA40B452_9PEZI|nr:RNA polymerase II-binding domain-containing protein [Lasiosphaeria miniovina]KAK0727360.1 RNA polymerase II-binding domain-containing protein [Lasiosphaeria miniovina]
MSYNDDAVLSKLSALNESQESIATTAQWIMFHRRHAAQTVHLWLTKLRDLPSPKRLNMIYLANEVVQQSIARHKDDFRTAFSPFICDATSTAYKGASADIQNKLKRVVDIWRERAIFSSELQGAMEAKLEELDRSRTSTKVGSFGASMFGSQTSSIPPELSPLVAPQQSVSKSIVPKNNALKMANTEFDKLTDLTSSPPAAAVFAARLTGLLKTLANAEGAVTECIRAHRELVTALEKILLTNKEELESEVTHLKKLSARRTAIEQKKQEVELAIMAGLPSGNSEQSSHNRPSGSPVPEPDRPQVEALTPPQVQDHDDMYTNSPGPQNGQTESVAGFINSPPVPPQATFPSAPGIELLSHLASRYQAVPVNGSKKRKIDASDDSPDLGGDDGIDAEVSEMLKRESHSS